MSKVLCRSSNYELAQALYERCRLQQPQNVQVLSNLAAVHLCLENWLEALKHAQLGLKIDPQHIKCLYRCGDAAMHLGQYTKAIHHLALAQKLVRLAQPAAEYFLACKPEPCLPPSIQHSCSCVANRPRAPLGIICVGVRRTLTHSSKNVQVPSDQQISRCLGIARELQHQSLGHYDPAKLFLNQQNKAPSRLANYTGPLKVTHLPGNNPFQLQSTSSGNNLKCMCTRRQSCELPLAFQLPVYMMALYLTLTSIASMLQGVLLQL